MRKTTPALSGSKHIPGRKSLVDPARGAEVWCAGCRQAVLASQRVAL